MTAPRWFTWVAMQRIDGIAVSEAGELYWWPTGEPSDGVSQYTGVGARHGDQLRKKEK